MSATPGIAAVNLDARVVLTTTDILLPIAQMIGADGHDTDDTTEALVVVAGTDEAGWYVVDLSHFDFSRELH